MAIFRALNLSTENVGRYIKRTKKKISWTFELDSNEHLIDLYISKLSGKIRVFCDGDIEVDTKIYSEVPGNYPVKISTRTLFVYQVGEHNYDLRLGNVSFTELMKEEESKKNITNQCDLFASKEPGNPISRSADKKDPIRKIGRPSIDKDPKVSEKESFLLQVKKNCLEDIDLLDLNVETGVNESFQHKKQDTVMPQMMNQGMAHEFYQNPQVQSHIYKHVFDFNQFMTAGRQPRSTNPFGN